MQIYKRLPNFYVNDMFSKRLYPMYQKFSYKILKDTYNTTLLTSTHSLVIFEKVIWYPCEQCLSSFSSHSAKVLAKPFNNTTDWQSAQLSSFTIYLNSKYHAKRLNSCNNLVRTQKSETHELRKHSPGSFKIYYFAVQTETRKQHERLSCTDPFARIA